MWDLVSRLLIQKDPWAILCISVPFRNNISSVAEPWPINHYYSCSFKNVPPFTKIYIYTYNVDGHISTGRRSTGKWCWEDCRLQSYQCSPSAGSISPTLRRFGFAQEVELTGLAGNRKVAGLISVLLRGVHDIDTKPLTASWPSPCMADTTVCECAHERVNVRRYCKALRVATWLGATRSVYRLLGGRIQLNWVEGLQSCKCDNALYGKGGPSNIL